MISLLKFEIKNLFDFPGLHSNTFVCFLCDIETLGLNMIDHVLFLIKETLCIPSKLHFMVRHNVHLTKTICVQSNDIYYR